MKIVFGNFMFGYLLYGGAEVQLERTKDALIQLGIDVRLFSQWDVNSLSDADILHWFHIDPYSNPVLRIAKQKGLKIVISSIYWPLKNALLETAWTRISSIPRRLGIPMISYKHLQRETLNFADMVVASSHTEASHLQRIFGVPWKKLRVIPVGVSESFAEASKELFLKRYGFEDFIICVGRVEPRKNQLGLLRATKDLGVPVVIIGDYSVEPEYYQRCLKVEHPNVYFLGRIEHNHPILKSAYAASRILAMPSTVEYPGLVAMEAALAGSRLVVTKFGNTKEYFGENAIYVNPYSVNSIKDGILKAMELPDLKVTELKQVILEKFTWTRIAEILLDLYRELLYQ